MSDNWDNPDPDYVSKDHSRDEQGRFTKMNRTTPNPATDDATDKAYYEWRASRGAPGTFKAFDVWRAACAWRAKRDAEIAYDNHDSESAAMNAWEAIRKDAGL